MNFKSLLIVLFFLPLLAFSAGKKKSEKDYLKLSAAKYSKAPMVVMQMEQSSLIPELNKKNVTKSKVYLSAGLLRIENTEPNKDLVIYDGKQIWMVQDNSDFGDKLSVIKVKIDKKNKAQVFITQLLTITALKNQVKILQKNKSNGSVVLDLEPLEKDLQIKDLKIQIQEEKYFVEKLSYKDDQSNEVNIYFSNFDFQKKKNSSLFQYKVPQGVQVMER